MKKIKKKELKKNLIQKGDNVPKETIKALIENGFSVEEALEMVKKPNNKAEENASKKAKEEVVKESAEENAANEVKGDFYSFEEFLVKPFLERLKSEKEGAKND